MVVSSSNKYIILHSTPINRIHTTCFTDKQSEKIKHCISWQEKQTMYSMNTSSYWSKYAYRYVEKMQQINVVHEYFLLRGQNHIMGARFIFLYSDSTCYSRTWIIMKIHESLLTEEIRKSYSASNTFSKTDLWVLTL